MMRLIISERVPATTTLMSSAIAQSGIAGRAIVLGGLIGSRVDATPRAATGGIAKDARPSPHRVIEVID